MGFMMKLDLWVVVSSVSNRLGILVDLTCL